MSAQRRGCKDLDQNANSNELPLLEGITGDFFLLRFPFIPKFPAVIMYCFCNQSYKCMLCCALSLSHGVSLRPHGLKPARLLCPWGFSRQEYWTGLPCPPPGDLPHPRTEPRSPALQANSLRAELPGSL